MTQEAGIHAKLKENEKEAKLFDSIMRATRRSLQANFGTYMKLVQADVSRTLVANAAKEGVSYEELAKLLPQLNDLMVQTGKELEKQVEAKVKADQAK